MIHVCCGVQIAVLPSVCIRPRPPLYQSCTSLRAQRAAAIPPGHGPHAAQGILLPAHHCGACRVGCRGDIRRGTTRRAAHTAPRAAASTLAVGSGVPARWAAAPRRSRRRAGAQPSRRPRGRRAPADWRRRRARLPGGPIARRGRARSRRDLVVARPAVIAGAAVRSGVAGSRPRAISRASAPKASVSQRQRRPAAGHPPPVAGRQRVLRPDQRGAPARGRRGEAQPQEVEARLQRDVGRGASGDPGGERRDHGGEQVDRRAGAARSRRAARAAST